MTISTLAPRARHRMLPPPPADPVTQYALDVTAGRIVAGKLVHLACERHLRDLATGKDRGIWFDARQAQKDIDFFHLLHHYKGRDDLIDLAIWQQFVVGSAFGWKREDGTRRFRYIYVECASKQGKSTIAGGAGLRLGFFDGEPGAEIYSAATKRDQAKIPWGAAVQMVRKSPSLRRVIQINAGSLSQASSASFFQPLGRDSDSDQGINPSGAIIDELHVHSDRDLLDNIEKAASVRRQPMIWKITTAGVKRESVWWEERADAVAILEGRATDDATFAIIYTLDDAHTESYGSSRAMQWMIQSCTCRRDTRSTHSSVATIPSDRPSASDSATVATDATSPAVTRQSASEPTLGRGDGQTHTESKSEPGSATGKPDTHAINSNGTASPSSVFPQRNTTAASLSRMGGAASADNDQSDPSAWTTTTEQDEFAAYSASHAIAPSASSGTLQRAYNEHSPTCAVRQQAVLQPDGLRVNIPGDSPFDEAVWPKANPNLGISVQVDYLRERAAKAQRSPGALAAYLRYHMNVPTSVSTRAIDIDEWDKNAAEPIIPHGAMVLGGLDLASVRDLTALIAVHRDDEGFLNVEARFWCPEEGIEHRSRVDGVPYADWVRDGWLIATPGNVTDYSYVEAEAGKLAEQYDVVEVGYDRWNASQLVTNLQSAGMTLVPISQTHSGLAAGWRELEKAVIENKLRHGGHPVLRWMAGNVEVETDSAGNQKPSKAHSSERIDGIVGLTMAIGRVIVHAESAASVYETRGALVFG